jgi:hypothetical protein
MSQKGSDVEDQRDAFTSVSDPSRCSKRLERRCAPSYFPVQKVEGRLISYLLLVVHGVLNCFL